MERNAWDKIINSYMDEHEISYIKSSQPNNTGPIKHNIYLFGQNLTSNNHLRQQHQVNNPYLFEQLDNRNIEFQKDFSKKLTLAIRPIVRSEFLKIITELDSQLNNNRYLMFKSIATMIFSYKNAQPQEIDMSQICDIFLFFINQRGCQIQKSEIQQYVSRFRRNEQMAELKSYRWDNNIKSDDNILTNDAYFDVINEQNIENSIIETFVSVTQNKIFSQVMNGQISSLSSQSFKMKTLNFITKYWNKFKSLPEWVQLMIVVFLIASGITCYSGIPYQDAVQKAKLYLAQ